MLQVAEGYGLSRSASAGGGTSWGTLLEGGCGRSPQRSRVWRLEALLRSLPLGSQSCLVCDGRTHPGLVRRGQLPELWRLAVGVVAQGGEHDVGQFPLQAAQGFAFGFAGGSFALVVGPAFGVAADLGDAMV
jgi:hypothetical protein